MRAIEISQKTHLVRHWFKWYRVQRGGTDWQRLKIEKRIPPMNLNKVVSSLNKKYPGGAGRLPTILDEKAADEEVVNNTPKKLDKKAKA